MFALLLSACLSGQLIEDSGAVVVVFLGVECPLSRLYANRLNAWQEKYPDARFVAVDANQHDTAEEVAAFAKDFGLRVPFVKDFKLARQWGATRNPEAFVLLNGEIKYRGRIDDRYAPGRSPRAEPSRRDLEIAIEEILAVGKASVSRTEPVGCFIDLPGDDPETRGVAYPQVAGIFHQRCAECHRPGQVAPFYLLTYADAAGWTETIREVLVQERMPPWGADAPHGRFVNDRSLTEQEKALLLAWLDAGAPEGRPADAPVPPRFTDGWEIGQPDVVLNMPRPFTIPAEGVIEYQEFVLDPHFSEDAWIQAIEVQPGNRSVVHHINVFQRPKNAAPDTLYMSDAGDFYLGVFLPGNSVTSFGPGIGKLVPAGWDIVLEVHYVATGAVEHDQSRIGLRRMDPADVRYQAASRQLITADYEIPPHSLATVRAETTLEDDYTLAALYPHMHLRGKSMLFEAIYPRGETETLLDVPRYDFGWQFRYELAKPKPLPKGTVLRCTAVYDNTSANPNNPDPAVAVRHGRRSTDEMFQAMFDVYRPVAPTAVNRFPLLAGFLIAGLLLLRCSGRSRRLPP
jgi:hypothetical protein